MKLFKKIRLDFKYRAAMAALAAGAGLTLSDDDRVNLFIIGFWIIGGIVEGFKKVKDLENKKRDDDSNGPE